MRPSRSRGASRLFEEQEPDPYIDSDYDMLDDNPKAAEAEAAFLQAKTFSEYTVGLLHGRMKPAEKREVMERFRAGDIDVLVSTTVIEVGVDVANATVMIVEDADRFGLAQLHQLRGRITAAEARPGISGGIVFRRRVVTKRLSAMERTEDGFELAEFDLSFRREGDILGIDSTGPLRSSSSTSCATALSRPRTPMRSRLCRTMHGSEELAVLRHELAAVFPPAQTGADPVCSQ
ncbi:MAG: helicase-related protein [Slackia sp.]